MPQPPRPESGQLMPTHRRGEKCMQRFDGETDRSGQPGVESALGRDRTRDGDLPPDLGTNRRSTGASDSYIDQAPVSVRQIADQAQQAVGSVFQTAQEQTANRLSGRIDQLAEG